MEERALTSRPLSLLFFNLFIVASSAASSGPTLRGAHPLDEKYYEAEVIRCKDGSKSITRDRVNDDFCDCPDGTDEPGTSACPSGKFYCRNLGSTPRFLFSSRVNDHICDCCDGSDDYDGVTFCPNTCIMGSSIEYKAEYAYRIRPPSAFQTKESKQTGKWDDLIHIFDLKVLASIQLFIVAYVLAFLLYRWSKLRRRQLRSELPLPNSFRVRA